MWFRDFWSDLNRKWSWIPVRWVPDCLNRKGNWIVVRQYITRVKKESNRFSRVACCLRRLYYLSFWSPTRVDEKEGEQQQRCMMVECDCENCQNRRCQAVAVSNRECLGGRKNSSTSGREFLVVNEEGGGGGVCRERERKAFYFLIIKTIK